MVIVTNVLSPFHAEGFSLSFRQTMLFALTMFHTLITGEIIFAHKFKLFFSSFPKFYHVHITYIYYLQHLTTDVNCQAMCLLKPLLYLSGMELNSPPPAFKTNVLQLSYCTTLSLIHSLLVFGKQTLLLLFWRVICDPHSNLFLSLCYLHYSIYHLRKIKVSNLNAHLQYNPLTAVFLKEHLASVHIGRFSMFDWQANICSKIRKKHDVANYIPNQLWMNDFYLYKRYPCWEM